MISVQICSVCAGTVPVFSTTGLPSFGLRVPATPATAASCLAAIGLRTPRYHANTK
jgi:hypothetical protein